VQPHKRLCSLVVIAAGALLVAGCEPQRPSKSEGTIGKALQPSIASTPAKTDEWTPERISKDPEGYCKHAEGLLASQLRTAEEKKAAAIEKLKDVTAQRDDFEANMEDVSNLLKRSRKAYEKANDEARWPAKFSGRAYSESELKKLIVSSDRYVEARRPLKKQYVATLSKLEKQVDVVDQYIEKLRDQQDRLSLDIDRIALAREGEALTELNQTAFDIAAITENLANEDSERVDLDELMKADSEKLQEDDFLNPK